MIKKLIFTVVGLLIAGNLLADVDLVRAKNQHGSDIYFTALAIYFEARNQSTAGQAAIAQVILNRVKDKRWGNTATKVVTWGYVPGKYGGCAFSFYCDLKLEVVTDTDAWGRALKIAYYVFAGFYPDLIDGADHYDCTCFKRPRWSKNMTRTTRIDTHIFWRSR